MNPSQVISGYFRFQSKSNNCCRCSLLGHAFVPLLPSVWPVSFVPPEAPHNHHLHPEQSQQLTHIEETQASNQAATHTQPHIYPLMIIYDHLKTSVFFPMFAWLNCYSSSSLGFLLNQVPRSLHWLRLVPATPSSNDKESPDVAPNSSRHSILIHSDQYYCTRWYCQWRC